MPNKGQAVSFLIILLVIIFASKVAISNGDNVQQNKNIPQEAFIAEEITPEIKLEEPTEPIVENTEVVSSSTTKELVFVTIDNGSEQKEFALEFSTTTTVLDVLQEACLAANFAIESQEYEFGVIIEAINNQRNGQDSKYWLYYINDVMPQLTPDKIQVNPNDKIDFKYTLR